MTLTEKERDEMAKWNPWKAEPLVADVVAEHNAVLAELRKAEEQLAIVTADRDFYKAEFQPVSAARDKAEARVRELESARSPRKAVAAQNVRLSPVHYAQTPHGFEVIQECDPDSYIAFTTSETDARMTAAEFNGFIQRCEKAEARVRELEVMSKQHAHHIDVLSRYFQNGEKYGHLGQCGDSLVDSVPKFVELYERRDARVQELEAECGKWIAENNRLVTENAEHRRHISAVMSREAEAKRRIAELEAEHTEAFTRIAELEAQLAAVQRVDPEAWKKEFKCECFIGGEDCSTVFVGDGNCATVNIYEQEHHLNSALSPTDAARAAMWLASYAQAHGAPVDIGTTVPAPQSVEERFGKFLDSGVGGGDDEYLVDAYLRGYSEVTGKSTDSISYSRTGIGYVRDAVLAALAQPAPIAPADALPPPGPLVALPKVVTETPAPIADAETQLNELHDLLQDHAIHIGTNDDGTKFVLWPDVPPWDIPDNSMKALAEIAQNAYKWKVNQGDDWEAVVTAILRAARPRVDVTSSEFLEVWSKTTNTFDGIRDVLALCNSRIRYGVELPPETSKCKCDDALGQHCPKCHPLGDGESGYSVPAVPTDAQIEALARLLYDIPTDRPATWETTCWQDDYRAEARAAYAHIGAELAAVTAERDKLLQLKDHWMDSVGRVVTERDTLRTELAARTTRPVKVRWNVAEEEATREWHRIVGTAGKFFMDYLAAHAVVDVPPGVPSVPELGKIGWEAWRNAQIEQRRNHLDKWEKLCESDRISECGQAAAIRDAVLAGAGECQECVKWKEERDEIDRNYMGLVNLILPHLRAAQADAARTALEGE